MEGITVNDVYEILQNEGISWEAGKGGGGKIVQAVTVLEIRKCKEWLYGGEMILTTLDSCKNDHDKVSLIKELSDSGASCIAIHPGCKDGLLNIDDIIVYANSNDLPLFLIDRKVPYSLIIKKIYEALLNKKEEALKKAQQINEMMNNILLSEGGAWELIEMFSTIIKKSVILLDDLFNPLAFKLKHDEEEILRDKLDEMAIWARSIIEGSILKDDCSKDFNVYSFEEGYCIVIIPISIGKEFYHYLLILEKNSLDKDERKLYKIALPGIINALKINMLTEQAILNTEQRLKYDFFDDIINKRHASDELMLKRGRTLGLNLLDRNYVIIVDLDDFEKYYRENNEKGEEHFQNIKNNLKKAIDRAFQEAGMRRRVILYVQQSDSCILVVGFTQKEYSTKQYKKMLDKIFNKIIKYFGENSPDISFTIGISSDIKNLNELKRAYDEAIFAKETGSKLFCTSMIHYYDNLGIYKFISIQKKEDILQDKIISKLCSYDEENKTNLLATLEAFLDSNASIKEAAQKIYVHPNTVKYRLKKIREIIDSNVLEDPQMRLYCHILIKVMKML